MSITMHGGYVRWRSRMVRQSVVEDVLGTLRATGWYGDEATVSLKAPLKVVDFYPEDAVNQGTSVELNTFGIDQGVAADVGEHEVGGLLLQPYRFAFAFWAESDAIAQSLYQDLADRYRGFTGPMAMILYDFNRPDPLDTALPLPITYMDVESFAWLRSPQFIAGINAYYIGELEVYDYLDQGDEVAV